MKSTYDTISAQVCKIITRKYSTSFSLGIYLLHGSLHKPIYAIYGFYMIGKSRKTSGRQLFSEFVINKHLTGGN